MSRRATLTAALAVVLAVASASLYALVFQAPVFVLMPHAPRDTSVLFRSQPEVIAHRGWSGAAPENTVAAFRKAAAADLAVELDVTLAKTGEVVVIHDDDVDRTTDGTGEVADLSWSELSGLDAGSWFGPEYAGEPLPTLEQALAALPPDRLVLVELKTADDKASLPEAVARILREDGRKRVMVISFDPFLLEQLRRAAPEIFRGQLVGDYADSDLAWYEKRALQNLVFTDRVQQDAVLWQHDLLTPKRVRQLKDAGYPVFAWTVNEPADIERIKTLRLAGVISDHPDRVRGR